MARKILPKPTHDQILSVLISTITESTSWTSIMEAVSEKYTVKNWMTVRNALQEAMDNDSVIRVDELGPDEVYSRVKPGETEVSNLEIVPVTLTDDGKKWVNEQCKLEKLNTVGKTTDQRLCLLAAKRGENVAIVSFLANGGKIDELPGFNGIKPLPNRKETCAGGKTEPEKAPRKPKKKESGDRREPGVPGRRKTDEHGVTLHEICDDVGVEARVARRKLRGSTIQKPGDSWVWKAGHPDIQKVKDLLK